MHPVSRHTKILHKPTPTSLYCTPTTRQPPLPHNSSTVFFLSLEKRIWNWSEEKIEVRTLFC